jgi:hypothetical protein
MRTLIIVLLFAGCSSYDPKLGPSPFLCGTDEPRCPGGYTCDDTAAPPVCLSKNGTAPDSMGNNFQCADDSNLEGATRNDDIQHAFQTPVATQRMNITFGMVAICPEGDHDTYAVQITVEKQNLEAISSWDSGMPVSVAILANDGHTLNAGAAMGEKALRAYVPNLPVGTYFVQTFAAAGVKNNYSIAINVTGP